jgi:hypothetical protein
MAIRHIATGHRTAERDVVADAYRRVVELDAALAEAVTVDAELHRWCEARLAELLALLEPHVQDGKSDGPPGHE